MPGALTRRVSSDTGFNFDFNPSDVHYLLKEFENNPRSGLDTAQVYTYWQIELKPDGKAERVLNYVAGPGGGAGGGAGTVDFEQFIFPGIIAMSVFFAALFNAVSLVYDREFGILKEVLVAPVSRAAVALGKTLGGATVATLQGTVIFVFAPFVGIRLTPLLVLQLWPIMFIGAFALSSMGIAIAARMRSIESFQMVNQFVMFPLIFLSGIFFPLQGLPAWMDVLVRINPVSYAVDPLRRLILQARPYWSHVCGYLVLSLLATPLALLMPLPLKIAISIKHRMQRQLVELPMRTRGWIAIDDRQSVKLSSPIAGVNR